MLKYLTATACIVVLVGCKSTNSSELAHDFGATSRVPEDHQFGPCETTFESKNRFPKTQAYLHHIAMHIMKSNSQVFKAGSNLDPKEFCINVKYDEEFNASALPNHRSIVFHTATILAAENDAAMAAVMAHELAHITMLHNLSQHPKFKATEQTLEVIEEAQALYRTLSAKMTQANQQRDLILTELDGLSEEQSKIQLQNELLSIYDEVFKEIIDDFGNVRLIGYADARNNFLSKVPADLQGSISKSMDGIAQLLIDIAPTAEEYGRLQVQMNSELLKSPEVGLDEGMNWEEQEADEVGFELYRRAGFKDDEFFNMLYTLAITSGKVTEKDVVSCLQRSFKTIAMSKGDFEPPRGFGSHPDYCWRIFDHQREHVLHETDYAQFPNNKVIISASGLADARAEIMADSRGKQFGPIPNEGKMRSTSPFPGNNYPGPNDGNRYPGPNDGSSYPGPNDGSSYPGPNDGNRYPPGGNNGGYPSDGGYPGPGSGYER